MVMVESIDNPILDKEVKGDEFLLKKGDYLLSINGAAISGHTQGTTLLESACGTLDLEVIRDRKALMVSITRSPDTKINLSSGAQPHSARCYIRAPGHSHARFPGGEMVVVKTMSDAGPAFGMVHEDDEMLDAWMRCDCARRSSRMFAVPTTCVECKRFLMAITWLPAPKGKTALAMEGQGGRRRSVNEIA